MGDTRPKKGISAARSDVHDSSERSLRALVESAPVILWTASATGWIDWYNERWFQYTGQTRQEAAGWGWQAAHHPEDFPAVMREWPESIATGRPFEMEFRLRGSDGTFRWFLTRINPLRDDKEQILRWYGSNVDVDEQHKSHDRTTRIAHTLQQAFIPKTLPHTESLRIDAAYTSADQDAFVGGDWYEAIELADQRILFSIGDVAAHGLDASIIASSIRQSITALGFRVDDPAEVLREVNEIVLLQHPNTTVTSIVGTINQNKQILQYACAGHQPPILARSREEEAQAEPFGGIPLGVRGDLHKVQTITVPIVQDMVIALYTDGVTAALRDITATERIICKLLPRYVKDITTGHLAETMLLEIRPQPSAINDAALMLIQFSRVPLTTEQLRKVLTKNWRFHSSDAGTANRSRHEVTTYLAGLAADHEETFFAELLLGEILANTVEHAPGLVEISIDWTAERPVLCVRDTGPGLSQKGPGELPKDIYSEDGRGLFLMKFLAGDISIGPAVGYGTEIRATLPIKRKP